MTEATQSKPSISLQHGDFCHVELPIKDVARAKRFYGELFGWTFHDVPEMAYTIFTTPNGMGGGFFHPSEQMPEAVMNYVNVASIEETAARLEALGGKSLSPKIEVPGHGWFMQVQDSEGTLIALWQA